MIRRLLPIFGTATLLCATSCTNAGTNSTPNVTPANIATQAKLQFGVGTATIAYSGGTVIGTNFVSTFRSTDGHSATLVNTPTITGPAKFSFGFGGATPNAISGILPNVFDSAIIAAKQTGTIPKSFGAGLGPLIGVFGYGMAADNLLSSQIALEYQVLVNNGQTCQDLNTSGTNTQTSPGVFTQFTINGLSVVGGSTITSEAQSHELGLPLGFGQDQLSNPPTGCPVGAQYNNPPFFNGSVIFNAPLPISYYGGPPAWPSAQGYGQPGFFVGYPLGFTDIAIAPVPGSYALDVAYPTNQTATTYAHLDASATLRTTTPLPPLTINSFVLNSDGTGSVTLNVPSPITEAVILVRTNDCGGSSTFDNYAVVTHSTGPQVAVFSANLGPPNAGGTPTSTFCASTDSPTPNATAYAVGFDYPAYESSYPFNVAQMPTIVNANGQADVTTSAPFGITVAP
jgi:hypothetical protein